MTFLLGCVACLVYLAVGAYFTGLQVRRWGRSREGFEFFFVLFWPFSASVALLLYIYEETGRFKRP